MTPEYFVEVADAAIYVKTWQPDALKRGTTPIILLHEGLGSVAMWREFPARLATATGRCVAAYDRAGSGRSSCPGARALDFDAEATRVLPAVMASLGAKRSILYGHSDGGTIALLAALTSPVEAVIAEAPHVFIEPTMTRQIAHTQARWTEGELRARLAKYHGTNLQQMFERWTRFWLQHDSRWSIVERLSGLTCPVLAVQGENDGYASMQHLQTIAERCSGPVQTRLIPSCGHAPHHEHSSLVVGLAADFVSHQVSAARTDDIEPVAAGRQ